MSNILSPTFGLGGNQSNSSLSPQISAHAQDFSISKLNQHKERAAASTSMGRVLRDAQYGANSGATSSIARIMRGDTSKNDDSYSMYTDDEREEIRTRLRYANIRKMMKEKKATIALEEKTSHQEPRLHIKTGSTYSKEGWSGTKRMLRKEFYKGRHSKYKHISASDKKHLEKIIEEGGSHGLVGGKYSHSTKKHMGRDAWKKYKQGDISKEDYKSFKGIIKDLD